MKIYVYAAVILALLASYAGVYRAGMKVAENSYQDAVIRHQIRENKLLFKLEQTRKEREIVYRERIKIIEGATGSCLAQPLPADIQRLFDDDRP